MSATLIYTHRAPCGLNSFPPEFLALVFGAKEQYIGPLEALASAAADYTFADVLEDSDAFYFIDNQGSLGSMVKGSSVDDGTSAVAQEAALQQRRNRTRAWYEYVNSDANIGDLPSRGRTREAARLLSTRFR